MAPSHIKSRHAIIHVQFNDVNIPHLLLENSTKVRQNQMHVQLMRWTSVWFLVCYCSDSGLTKRCSSTDTIYAILCRHFTCAIIKLDVF